MQILIEAKKVNDPLRIEHSSQLFRYFAVTNARVAVLTNGEVYEFYTDLDAPNKMDDKPLSRPRPRCRRPDAPARTGQAGQGVLRPRLGDQCR